MERKSRRLLNLVALAAVLGLVLGLVFGVAWADGALVLENTEEGDEFETGEEISFDAKYVADDATGITLLAEVYRNGESEACTTLTGETNEEEFGFRLWDEGSYRLTVSAIRNGEALASEDAEFSVEAPYGYLNTEAKIPQYWPMPADGSTYRLSLDYENQELIPDLVDIRIYRSYDINPMAEWIGVSPETVLEFPIVKHNSYTVNYTQYKQGFSTTRRDRYNCKPVIGTLETPTLTVPATLAAGEKATVTVGDVPNASYYRLHISGPQSQYGYRGTVKTAYSAGEYVLEEYGLDGGEYTIEVKAYANYDYAESGSATYTLVVEGERPDAPKVFAPAGTFTSGDLAWFTVTGDGMTAAARNGYYHTVYQAESGTAKIPVEIYRGNNIVRFRGMFDGKWSEETGDCTVTGAAAEKPDEPEIEGPRVTLNPAAPKRGQNLRVNVAPVKTEGAAIYAVSLGRRYIETWGEDQYDQIDQILYDMPFEISEGGVTIQGCNLMETGEYCLTVSVYSGENGDWLCETNSYFTVTENPEIPAAPGVRLLTEENLLYGISEFEITTAGGADRIYAFISRQDDYGLEENPIEIAMDPEMTEYTLAWRSLRAGTYEAYFSVSRNGIWSDWPEPLVFEVTMKDDELADPGELRYPEEIAIGEPLTVSWNAVDGAEWYDGSAYFGYNEFIYDKKLEKDSTALTIDTGLAAHSGGLYVGVRAYVPGYYYGDLYTKERISVLDPRLQIAATVTDVEDTGVGLIAHLQLANVQANRVRVKADGKILGIYGLGPNSGTAEMAIPVPAFDSVIRVQNYDTDERKWGTWSEPVSGDPIPAAAKTLYLPADLKEIEANAFEGIDAEAVIIPDGCTAIGAGAFRDCTKLRFVSYKQGTGIGEGAFDGCDAGLRIEER